MLSQMIQGNNNYQIQLIAHSLFETVSQIAAGNQVCREWEYKAT